MADAVVVSNDSSAIPGLNPPCFTLLKSFFHPFENNETHEIYWTVTWSVWSYHSCRCSGPHLGITGEKSIQQGAATRVCLFVLCGGWCRSAGCVQTRKSHTYMWIRIIWELGIHADPGLCPWLSSRGGEMKAKVQGVGLEFVFAGLGGNSHAGDPVCSQSRVS